MGKQEWIFIIPDKPNSLEARMKVRPYVLPCSHSIDPIADGTVGVSRQHLEELKPHVESGAIVLGGASLDEPLKEGVGMKTNGSVLIIESETEAEARKIVEGDVYYTAGIWDVEKVCLMMKGLGDVEG